MLSYACHVKNSSSICFLTALLLDYLFIYYNTFIHLIYGLKRKSITSQYFPLTTFFSYFGPCSCTKLFSKNFKFWTTKSLCKYICNLIFSSNIFHLNVSLQYIFSNKVIVYFHMLSSSIKKSNFQLF